MNKRNIIIVAMLAMILMGSVVLSAQNVTFQSDSRDIAKNVQGYIYVWDNSIEDYVHANDGLPVRVTLKSTEHDAVETEVVYTFNGGTYNHNFEDPFNNQDVYNRIQVRFNGETHIEPYDGCAYIEIYWDQLINDPTDPGIY